MSTKTGPTLCGGKSKNLNPNGIRSKFRSAVTAQVLSAVAAACMWATAMRARDTPAGCHVDVAVLEGRCLAAQLLVCFPRRGLALPNKKFSVLCVRKSMEQRGCLSVFGLVGAIWPISVYRQCRWAPCERFSSRQRARTRISLASNVASLGLGEKANIPNG